MPTLHAKQIFIVLAVTLFSFSANAQITTTVSGGTAYTTPNSNFQILCGSNSSGYSSGISSLHDDTNTITITYSAPVTAVKIPFATLGTSTSGETHRFDVVGQTTETLSFGCSGVVVSGNTGRASTANHYYGEAILSSNNPFTQIQISKIAGSLVGIPTSDFFNANNLIIGPSQCPSTPVIPSLSTTTISNVCPANRANLTSITASNTPTNATLTWHTSIPASNANKISNPASVTSGIYRAAFFYSSMGCYSDNNGTGTKAVTITINTCCNAGTSAPLFK